MKDAMGKALEGAWISKFVFIAVKRTDLTLRLARVSRGPLYINE